MRDASCCSCKSKMFPFTVAKTRFGHNYYKQYDAFTVSHCCENCHYRTACVNPIITCHRLIVASSSTGAFKGRLAAVPPLLCPNLYGTDLLCRNEADWMHFLFSSRRDECVRFQNWNVHNLAAWPGHVMTRRNASVPSSVSGVCDWLLHSESSRLININDTRRKCDKSFPGRL